MHRIINTKSATKTPTARGVVVGPSPAESMQSIDNKLTILIKLFLLHLQSQGFEQKTLESVLKGEEAQD